MTPEQFADRLLRRLGEARDAAATPVIGGAMQDFACYRHQCGVIAGLSRAIAATRRELRLLTTPDAPLRDAEDA
jgi:hypothetical protein